MEFDYKITEKFKFRVNIAVTLVLVSITSNSLLEVLKIEVLCDKYLAKLDIKDVHSIIFV